MGRDFWVGVGCIAIIMIVSAIELVVKHRYKKMLKEQTPENKKDE